MPDPAAAPASPPPSGDPAPSPTPEATPPTTSPSPDGEKPTEGQAEPKPEGEVKPEPEAKTPEQLAAEAAEAARAVVPDAPEGFKVEIGDDLKAFIPEPDTDPALKALREHAKAKGWSQGRFDDVMDGFKALTEAKVLSPPMNFAAETAKLSADGKNGAQRQAEAQTYADALLQRKDITDEEHAQLLSLLPVAAGVTLLEKMRAMSQNPNPNPDPSGGDVNADPIAKAKEMRRDPRYDTDKKFKREADAAWMAAYDKK